MRQHRLCNACILDVHPFSNKHTLHHWVVAALHRMDYDHPLVRGKCTVHSLSGSTHGIRPGHSPTHCPLLTHVGTTHTNIKSTRSPLLLHSLPLLPWRTTTTTSLTLPLLLLRLSLLLSLLLVWLLLPPLWGGGGCWHLAARKLPNLCC